MIITLDGPAGVGKSTLAKLLAKHFDIACLDTGAMYRTIGFLLGENAQNFSETEIKDKLNHCQFELKKIDDNYFLFINSKKIGNEIRTQEVSKLAAIVGNIPAVRKILQDFQREIGKNNDLVTEGRDMGTVVFPQAEFKIFLDASVEVRAKRRFDELSPSNPKAKYDEIYTEIFERDRQDRQRINDPLKPAKDAIIIDTSNLSIEQVFEKIVQIASNSTDGQAK